MWFRHGPHRLRGETIVLAGDLIRCSFVGERRSILTTTFTQHTACFAGLVSSMGISLLQCSSYRKCCRILRSKVKGKETVR